MAKLVSNKDGRVANRAKSYSSYTPASYSVVNSAGEVIGEFAQILDHEYNFKTTVWVGMGKRFQYLKQVREFVAGL